MAVLFPETVTDAAVGRPLRTVVQPADFEIVVSSDVRRIGREELSEVAF